MRCYNQSHRFYCGVDLHARSLYAHVLDAKGQTVLDRDLPASGAAFLDAVAPFRDGLVVGSEFYRVRQAVDDWLRHGQGETDQATRERNRELCMTHILPKLGGRKLRDLTPGDVDTWLSSLTDALATSSIRRVKSCLSRSVRRAMRRGLVDRNVVDLCDVPRGSRGARPR